MKIKIKIKLLKKISIFLTSIIYENSAINIGSFLGWFLDSKLLKSNFIKKFPPL
jgi:hypothetical protein